MTMTMGITMTEGEIAEAEMHPWAGDTDQFV
jgi:hypothetical protein